MVEFAIQPFLSPVGDIRMSVRLLTNCCGLPSASCADSPRPSDCGVVDAPGAEGTFSQLRDTCPTLTHCPPPPRPPLLRCPLKKKHIPLESE